MRVEFWTTDGARNFPFTALRRLATSRQQRRAHDMPLRHVAGIAAANTMTYLVGQRCGGDARHGHPLGAMSTSHEAAA